MPYALLALVVFTIVVLVRSVKVVPQKQVKIIERLGKFHSQADAGLNIILPFVDTVRASHDLAERARRAVVTTAEGEKASAILRAEGLKQSAIVSAEGQKQSAILGAEGQAEARLRIAQAESQAIQLIAQALGSAGNPAQYLIAK